jgi:hypothetical protein
VKWRVIVLHRDNLGAFVLSSVAGGNTIPATIPVLEVALRRMRADGDAVWLYDSTNDTLTRVAG